MTKAPIFQTELAEKAFRHWQVNNSGKLMTLWTVSTEKEKGMEYDVFCLRVYTGHIKTKLVKQVN